MSDRRTAEPSGTPIPRRTAEQQAALYRTLLAASSFPARFSYLLDYESFVHYDERARPVVDPEAIAQQRFAARERASAQTIADWIHQHREVSISRQQINNMKTGRRPMGRAPLMNAFADFWRVDARIFDPAIPADQFGAVLDTKTKLPADDRRILELMNSIGLESVQAREISSALGGSTRDHKKALLEILTAISRDQETSADR